MIQNNTVTLES